MVALAIAPEDLSICDMRPNHWGRGGKFKGKGGILDRSRVGSKDYRFSTVEIFDRKTGFPILTNHRIVFEVACRVSWGEAAGASVPRGGGRVLSWDLKVKEKYQIGSDVEWLKHSNEELARLTRKRQRQVSRWRLLSIVLGLALCWVLKKYLQKHPLRDLWQM